MPNQNEPNQLNSFQYFLRGADAIKSTTASATTLSSNNKGSEYRKNTLIYAGTIQVGFAILTTAGMIGRVIQDPKRLSGNAIGLLLRSGIVLLDLASGAMMLADPEEETPLSTVGLSLMACSIFASRLIAEDGHHDIKKKTPKLQSSDESKETDPLVTSSSKQSYGNV